VPFLVVTGTGGEEAAAERIKQGAADYLLRDRLARLGSAVESALNMQRARQEKRWTEVALEESNRRLREALDQLQATQRQVIQQERLRALGEMASGITHDFNNLLAMIAGCSELPLLRPSDLDDRDKVRAYLQVINSAAMDATSIVGRLREFYRPRDANETFDQIDVNCVIEQVVTLTGPR
jgi:C4-dicarboxylate-specific signal transduction histidine kinase